MLNKVLKSVLAPFIIFVAQYSKKIMKEPKEDFILLSNQLFIHPKFNISENAEKI